MDPRVFIEPIGDDSFCVKRVKDEFIIRDYVEVAIEFLGEIQNYHHIQHDYERRDAMAKAIRKLKGWYY